MLITRRRHRRELANLTAVHAAQMASWRDHHSVFRLIDAQCDAAERIQRRADAFDLDADHVDGRKDAEVRKIEPMSASARRVVADELRDVARDVAGRRE